MAPGPELSHGRWGRGAGLSHAIPSLWTCEDSVFYRDADWYLRCPGGQQVGRLFFPLPLGLRWPFLAGRILSSLYQMPPPAVTQPGCYSASLLLAAAFCFLDFSLFGGFVFFPQCIILSLSQGRVSLTALASVRE